ncbi:MAG TPA: hypothetical protein VH592_09470 [Gemmataceae bacterium]|jgi:hypothetical protein
MNKEDTQEPSSLPTNKEERVEEIERIQDIVATRLAEIIWMQHFDPRYKQDKDKPTGERKGK